MGDRPWTPYGRLIRPVMDIVGPRGLLHYPAEDPAFKAPPKTKWEDGAMNLGMFRALYTEGQYIVFVGNTTGNIPLGEVDEDVAAGDAPMCLRRWVTSDFSEWGGGECVQTFDASDMGAIKTMARNDQTGMLYAILYESKNRLLYTSDTDGMTWTGPLQTQGLASLRIKTFLKASAWPRSGPSTAMSSRSRRVRLRQSTMPPYSEWLTTILVN